MTMITPSYLGETIEYSSLHACRSTLEDPTLDRKCLGSQSWRFVAHEVRVICAKKGALQTLSVPKNDHSLI